MTPSSSPAPRPEPRDEPWSLRRASTLRSLSRPPCGESGLARELGEGGILGAIESCMWVWVGDGTQRRPRTAMPPGALLGVPEFRPARPRQPLEIGTLAQESLPKIGIRETETDKSIQSLMQHQISIKPDQREQALGLFPGTPAASGLRGPPGIEPAAARRVLLSSRGRGVQHRSPGPEWCGTQSSGTGAALVNLGPVDLTAVGRLSAALPGSPAAELEAAGGGNAPSGSAARAARDGQTARRAADRRPGAGCSEPAAAARRPRGPGRRP